MSLNVKKHVFIDFFMPCNINNVVIEYICNCHVFREANLNSPLWMICFCKPPELSALSSYYSAVLSSYPGLGCHSEHLNLVVL